MPDTFVDVGGLVRCACGIPLARRTSRESVEIVKNHGRERVPVNVEYRGSTFKLSCPTCGFGAIFASIIESIGISEEVSTVNV